MCLIEKVCSMGDPNPKRLKFKSGAGTEDPTRGCHSSALSYHSDHFNSIEALIRAFVVSL